MKVKTAPAKKKLRKGFAAMKAEDVLRIARMGGTAVSRNREHMARIGFIGGSRKSGA